MAQIAANGITLEYDTFGDASDKPLLLVMGLGTQMIAWDEAFCEQLVSKGHYVIRYDNRDIGLSEKMDDQSVPDMAEMMVQLIAGEKPDVPYTLEDMANDGIGLLDALGIDKAHICGASMGGMIAQIMALKHPERVLTLTSIMSSTGNPDLPKATSEAQAVLMAPRADSLDSAIERAINSAKAIGSPGFEFDIERTTRKAIESFERSFYPAGVARQMAAIAANGDRSEALKQLDLPTLVIHGKDDALVPVEAGIDTHNCIKGSELLLIDGMGHDLPPGAWDEIVGGISALTARQC